MPSNPFDHELVSFAACVGIDWADRQHALAMQVRDDAEVKHAILPQTPEALEQWAMDLRQRFSGQPVAIAVELNRGPLIHALMKYPHLVIYPVPPARLANYRRAFVSSGAKDDPTDAVLILDYLIKHGDQLRPWRPDDAQTRELAMLVEQRRGFVDQRTALSNQLKAQLKDYFPQAMDYLGDDLTTRMAADFLLKWPDLASLKRAKDQTIRQFFYRHNVRRPERVEQRIKAIRQAVALTDDAAVLHVGIAVTQALAKMLRQLAPIIDGFEKQIRKVFADHEDAHLFANLPGAGPALAPRLLVAFGSDRDRYEDATQVQSFVGIAPVTRRSGKQQSVHRRWACPNFLRQSFHEFAQHSIRQSAWARAYYQLQRDRGKGHNAAVRALAFKWIRVLFACWKSRTPYDEACYLARVRERAAPLCRYLPAA